MQWQLGGGVKSRDRGREGDRTALGERERGRGGKKSEGNASCAE